MTKTNIEITDIDIKAIDIFLATVAGGIAVLLILGVSLIPVYIIGMQNIRDFVATAMPCAYFALIALYIFLIAKDFLSWADAKI